jgi:glycosyltransferase involved in cell wall biosynthesis
VITPVGGIAELFTDGQEGRFVAPNDGRALAAAVLDLLHAPRRRRAMGAAARALVECRYDAEHTTGALVELLREATRPVATT